MPFGMTMSQLYEEEKKRRKSPWMYDDTGRSFGPGNSYTSFTPSLAGITGPGTQGRRAQRTAFKASGFTNKPQFALPTITPGMARASVTHKGANVPGGNIKFDRERALEAYEMLRTLGYAPTPGVAFNPMAGTVGGVRPGGVPRITVGSNFMGTPMATGGAGGGTGGAVIPGKGGGTGMAAGGRVGGKAIQTGFDPRLLTTQQPTGAGGVSGAGVTGGGGGYGFGTAPSPYAQGDYGRELGLLSTTPEQVLDQYGAISNLGVMGPGGMETIRQTGIYPAKERLEDMPEEIMGLVRAGEAHRRTAASTALGKRFGGQMAGQPGRAATAIMETVFGPSLEREARMAAGLTESQIEGLNTLDLMSASLEERNMMSKATVGLPGMQSALSQIDAMVARRYKDTSLENKFGYAPERRAALESRLQKERAAWGIEAQKQAAYWNYYYQAQLMMLADELEGSDFGFDDLLNIGIDIGTLILTKKPSTKAPPV